MSNDLSAQGPDPRIALKSALSEQGAHHMWFFLGAVIGVCTLINWTSKAIASFVPRNPPRPGGPTFEDVDAGRTGAASVRRLPAAVLASLRIFAFRMGIPTGKGGVVLFSEFGFMITYMTATFLILLTQTQGAQLFWYEDKAAAMATIQVPLIVALAGKNNVLSFLTGVGHEKLNILHRTSARTCLILLWIHALGHITQGLPAKFDFSHDWMRSGAVGLGGFTMATILSIRPLRHIGFEFFLIGHIVFILIFLIGGYHHVPDFSPEMRGYIWPAFVFWGIDRAQRVGRILLNNTIWRGTNPEHSHGTVELISDDTLKLTLRRSMNWKAGQHAYVILPSVSTLPIEAHPFSIASVPYALDGSDSPREKEVTFIIRARDGFTGRMRRQAATRGAFSVPAFIDGPYGCPPDLSRFSTCVLVSGGSGVSYTLPLLQNLVHLANRDKTSCRRVVFVWTVRSYSHIAWIAPMLDAACAAAPVTLSIDLRLHVTSMTASSSSSLEKSPDIEALHTPINSPMSEKSPSFQPRTLPGRPNLREILRDEVHNAAGPVSVDVSGPAALAQTVRALLREPEIAGGLGVLRGRAPVTLHVETFGM